MSRCLWIACASLAVACTVKDGAGRPAVDAGGSKTDDPDGSGGGMGGSDAAGPTTTERLAKALAYGESVVGTPYGWWLEGPIPPGPPMYATDVPPPDPAEVRAESVNCAGLVNLMLRSVGIPIPHHPDALTGGTYAYQLYYDAAALPFDPETKYPAGTLIGRRFRDVEDQGHLAVVLTDGHVLQSFAWEPGGSEPGVNTTYTVEESHDGGFYEYAVLPHDWLR